MRKGEDKGSRAIKEKYGMRNIEGGIAEDRKLTFHTINWLGYCVNDAPSMMIKRKGKDYVEVLSGLSSDIVSDRLNSLRKSIYKVSKSDIATVSLKNTGDYSLLSSEVSVGEAIKKAATMGPLEVIKMITDSKLLGRSGTGFMTGKKWEAAYKENVKEKFVVCNADEGLPSTFKNWFLLNDNEKRKQALAGMGICANTIGARRCFIYVRYEYRNLVPAIEKDIKELQKECPDLSMLHYEVREIGRAHV